MYNLMPQIELGHFPDGNTIDHQYRKEKKKWFNIRSWVDGDSAKDPEDVLEKQLKTRQVGILEAKGECYFKAERVMNYDKLIGQ